MGEYGQSQVLSPLKLNLHPHAKARAHAYMRANILSLTRRSRPVARSCVHYRWESVEQDLDAAISHLKEKGCSRCAMCTVASVKGGGGGGLLYSGTHIHV